MGDHAPSSPRDARRWPHAHHESGPSLARHDRHVAHSLVKSLPKRVEEREHVPPRVGEIVTYDATTLPRDAGIETAARTMRERGVRRLPIVTDEGTVIGIVTADDLTILLAKELADVGAGLADNVTAEESR